MQRVIGLTGGIASGKSTVSQRLRELGAHVIDADAITYRLSEPGQPLWTAYRAHFGDLALAADGTLDRKAIGALVFTQPPEREWIDRTAHPLVMAEMRAEMARHAHEVIVLDVPLLFEVGWDTLATEVWLVYVNAATQLARLRSRNGWTEAEARNRIASQMSLEEKRRRADLVIDNSGDLAHTYRQVEQYYNGKD